MGCISTCPAGSGFEGPSSESESCCGGPCSSARPAVFVEEEAETSTAGPGEAQRAARRRMRVIRGAIEGREREGRGSRWWWRRKEKKERV